MHFTVSSLKDIFESVDNQTVVDFSTKNTHFYRAACNADAV